MGCVDENVLSAYLAFQLTPEESDQLFRHLDECERCANLFNEVAAALATQDSAAQITAPERDRVPSTAPMLGRYRIERILGMGGMGVVYAGYDPELDRKVAIKLLQPDSKITAGTLRARLMREAQAMAQLTHPNVINVFEVGAFGEQVFVVMELIDGKTLGAWLREEPRGWREIVAAFVAAGAGLEAAHKAGIIHRDFKPENVLVGKDGRICVTDFGLARRATAAAGEETGPIAAEVSPISPTVTRSGQLLGTPAYMAPEQMRGEATDERTDVFSFSVALYEALYGTRPYHGKNLEELRGAIERGQIEPPRRVVGPSSYRRAVERGLRGRPDERPSLSELLRVLRDDPGRRRRQWIFGAGAGLLAIAVTLSFVQMRRRTRVCVGAEAKLAGIWDSARKREVHQAFSATGLPYAGAAFTAVEKQLDGFVGEWVAMRGEACEATRLRGTQSEDLLDLRMACLDERLAELRAQTDLFSSADKKTVEKAASAVSALSPIADCADVAALRAVVRKPSDPAIRARIAAVEGRLQAARAAQATAHYPEAVPIVAEATQAAHEIGYRPLEAEVLSVTGILRLQTGNVPGAVKAFTECTVAAEAGGASDTAADAWRELARANNVLGKYDDAQAALRQAAARLERHPDPLREASLAYVRGLLDSAQGRFAEAEKSFRHALALREKKLGPDSLEVADVLDKIAGEDTELERNSEALEAAQRSLAIRERALGLTHPSVARSLNALGMALRANKRLAEALAAYRRALEIIRAALGPDHPSLLNPLGNIANTLAALGRYEESIAMTDEMLRINEKAFGPNHPESAAALCNRTGVLRKMKRFDECLKDAKRALAINEASSGPKAVTVRALLYIGTAFNDLHRSAEALAPLERALAANDEPIDVALSRKELARALLALHRDPARARELAVAARATLASDPDHAEDVREIDAHLDPQAKQKNSAP